MKSKQIDIGKYIYKVQGLWLRGGYNEDSHILEI